MSSYSKLPVFKSRNFKRPDASLSTSSSTSFNPTRAPRPPTTSSAPRGVKRAVEDGDDMLGNAGLKRSRTSMALVKYENAFDGKAPRHGPYLPGGTSLSDKPISPLLLPVNGKAVKRGRYALQSSPIHTKFQIDPARNSGLGHKFAEVVRGKARESLPAHDCPECTEYYDAIGIMPPRLHAPLWRSPSSPPHSRADHVCMHKNDISRHRAAWSPAKTPPGYWNIGFPDSEEVKRINTRAATMREEKEQFMSREAAKPKGRYRKHK